MTTSPEERCRSQPGSPNPSRSSGWFIKLMTTDHFPKADRFLRRLVWNPLGGLGLALVVSLGCAHFVHPRAFVPAPGLLLVLVLGVAWPWLSLIPLRAIVGFSKERAREGEPVEISSEVSNWFPCPAWGVVLEGESVLLGFDSIPGRRKTRQSAEHEPLCRGVHPRGRLHLKTGFPFGLFEARRVVRVDRPLLVWPRTFPVPTLPHPSGENDLEGGVSRTRAGAAGDVLGVRPYRRGDSPRRIHQAQSARHDRLIVCELESTARPLVLIALDDDLASHAGTGTDSSREWAIRIAASLFEGWLARGAEIAGLWRGEFLAPAAGNAHQQAFLDALARLPDTPGPNLGTLLDHPDWRSFRGLRVLIASDRALANRGPETLAGVRLVVLHADAFSVEPRPARPAEPTRPSWLWINDPAQVPEQLKQALQGS
jgi:uncharacterized protein (DUF58 family)